MLAVRVHLCLRAYLKRWFDKRSIIASHCEAIIRGYRHHSSDVPTYDPTHTIGYYGLTWDYTVMKLLKCL